jgi:hypothetical protein
MSSVLSNGVAGVYIYGAQGHGLHNYSRALLLVWQPIPWLHENNVRCTMGQPIPRIWKEVIIKSGCWYHVGYVGLTGMSYIPRIERTTYDSRTHTSFLICWYLQQISRQASTFRFGTWVIGREILRYRSSPLSVQCIRPSAAAPLIPLRKLQARGGPRWADARAQMRHARMCVYSNGCERG